MDGLTQIVLGAAVGEAVLGKKVGNKAILWGGICGIVPDSDVLFMPFFDEIKRLIFHRGYSHSILFSIIIPPLIAYIIYKIYKGNYASYYDWWKLCFWSYFTHPILDCFTNYGTGFFLPISQNRIAFNSIFIIDPLYTLPLLISLVILAFFKRDSKTRKIINITGLSFSSIYLISSLMIKFHVNSIFKDALKLKNIKYRRYMTQVTPFNIILWEGYFDVGNGYLITQYSLLDKDSNLKFVFIKKNEKLIEKYENTQAIRNLRFFSKDFFVITKKNKKIYFNDLRFGSINGWLKKEKIFVFSLQIIEKKKKILVKRSTKKFHIEKGIFNKLFQRIKGNSKLY